MHAIGSVLLDTSVVVDYLRKSDPVLIHHSEDAVGLYLTLDALAPTETTANRYGQVKQVWPHRVRPFGYGARTRTVPGNSRCSLFRSFQSCRSGVVEESRVGVRPSTTVSNATLLRAAPGQIRRIILVEGGMLRFLLSCWALRRNATHLGCQILAGLYPAQTAAYLKTIEVIHEE